jgi:hypothetical protein
MLANQPNSAGSPRTAISWHSNHMAMKSPGQPVVSGFRPIESNTELFFSKREKTTARNLQYRQRMNCLLALRIAPVHANAHRHPNTHP